MQIVSVIQTWCGVIVVLCLQCVRGGSGRHGAVFAGLRCRRSSAHGTRDVTSPRSLRRGPHTSCENSPPGQYLVETLLQNCECSSGFV